MARHQPTPGTKSKSASKRLDEPFENYSVYRVILCPSFVGRAIKHVSRFVTLDHFQRNRIFAELTYFNSIEIANYFSMTYRSLIPEERISHRKFALFGIWAVRKD